MARTYGRILTSMWQNPKFRQLSEHSRTVWIYLCSSPHSNAAGCFVLPIAYASHDCQLSPSRFEAAIAEIALAEMIIRDGDVVFVRDWFEHNKPTGGKHARAMLSAILQCPSKSLKCQALEAFIECDSKIVEPLIEEARSELATIPDPSEPGSRTVIAKTQIETQTQIEIDSSPPKSADENGSRTKSQSENQSTRLADDFDPPQEWLEAGMAKGGLTEMEVQDEWNGFYEYWTNQRGQRAKKKNWFRTWINYITSDICQKRVGSRRRNATQSPQAAGVAGSVWRVSNSPPDRSGAGSEPLPDRKLIEG